MDPPYLPWHVVAIDLDGTLLPSTTVNRLLADRLGVFRSLDQIEAGYASGALSNSTVASALARELAGQPVEELVAAMNDAPLLRDAAIVIRALRDHGLHVILASVTWNIAVDRIGRECGVDGHCGVELETRKSKITGRVVANFDERDKLRYVRRYCGSVGVRISNCVAIGDGRSDLPLFAAAGYSVALNASFDLQRAASASLRADSLAEAVRAVPELAFV